MTLLSNPCIITGITMVMQLRDLACHGDLFLQGDQFIFNAVFNEETQASLWLDTPQPRPKRHIELQLGCHYWERRGVFVIPLTSLKFSPEALAYIRPALEGSPYLINESRCNVRLQPR